MLAFCLFMLALMTLAAINMVQQNKLDFMMVKNSRDQTKAFTDVEQLLSQLESGLLQAKFGTISIHKTCVVFNATTGLYDHSACGNPAPTAGVTNAEVALKCKPTDQGGGRLVQTPIYAGSTANGALVGGTIVAVSCLKDVSQFAGQSVLQENLCTTYDTATGTTYCYPDNTTASKVACTPTDTNPVPAIANSSPLWECYRGFEGEAIKAHCPTEIYTMQLTSPTDVTGASRTIESKYGVNCGVCTPGLDC